MARSRPGGSGTRSGRSATPVDGSWESIWESHRASFEDYLDGLYFSEEPRLAGLVEAMRYSMLGGGKRVRPTLCMEVARLFGADPASVLPAAAAVEPRRPQQQPPHGKRF